MFWLFASLTAASFGMMAVAIVWGIREKGRTEHRSGPEAHAEAVRSIEAQEARLEGEALLVNKAWSAGHGRSVDGEVSYSWRELVGAWRRRELRPVAPGLVMVAGIPSAFLFGALTLLATSGPGRWVGVVLLVMFGVALRIVVGGLRAAAVELDAR